MDWLGIGVLVFAVAFLIAVICLLPAMRNLAKTLDKTATTVAQLEKKV